MHMHTHSLAPLTHAHAFIGVCQTDNLKCSTTPAFAMPFSSLLMSASLALAVTPQAIPEVTPMTPDVVTRYEQDRPEADFVKRVVMVPAHAHQATAEHSGKAKDKVE